MKHPYRSAPPRPPVAPRASWWRRLWHRGVERRLDIRRRRAAALAVYPWATWAQRHKLATADHDADQNRFWLVAVDASKQLVLREIARSAPPPLDAKPRRPRPPATPIPGPPKEVSE